MSDSRTSPCLLSFCENQYEKVLLFYVPVILWLNYAFFRAYKDDNFSLPIHKCCVLTPEDNITGIYASLRVTLHSFLFLMIFR